ncbi:MAG: Unknown protein [uncultured Thiotrichaceae bacterium]|uniref:Uncharacterized protein n=1 Tax=uncultured Thiotrichaceae bacterium TaxID=298394 RepID=A0A6S6T8W3_9GAMM|nr:MAG: Unknown protein [uncultured Thiotrichaceae bacterium]
MVKTKAIFLQTFVLATAIGTAFSPHTSYAEEYVPYKIDMKRSKPEEPIRKSSIMKKVRDKWPGRILHISSDGSGGPDCHTVKSMGLDGEFRIIRVSCRD